jgi:hypothetical protein
LLTAPPHLKPLTELLSQNGFIILIDDGDFEWLNQYKWSVYKNRRTYYAHATIAPNKVVLMHRLIMGFPVLSIDHIDNNGINNTKQNLRLATKSQQQYNKKPITGRKYKGVSKRGNRFAAQIRDNGKVKWLGSFTTEEEAAIAYNMAATKMHGKYANLNIVRCLSH